MMGLCSNPILYLPTELLKPQSREEHATFFVSPTEFKTETTGEITKFKMEEHMLLRNQVKEDHMLFSYCLS
jgi:hypothetical protein